MCRIFDKENSRVRKNTDFLLNDSCSKGEIYVAGTPLIYQYSKRRQATALNGWAPEFFLPEQWEELASEISDKKPAYIFIDSIYKSLFESKAAKFLMILKSDYVLDHNDVSGNWYRIKEST
jgi:hypothetical protein